MPGESTMKYSREQKAAFLRGATSESTSALSTKDGSEVRIIYVTDLANVDHETMEPIGLAARYSYPESTVNRMKESISDNGMLERPVVAPDPDNSSRFFLISGLTRIRAITNGDPAVPFAVVINHKLDMRRYGDPILAAYRYGIASNDERTPESSYDRAKAFIFLHDHFGLSDAEIGEIQERPVQRSQVNRLRNEFEPLIAIPEIDSILRANSNRFSQKHSNIARALLQEHSKEAAILFLQNCLEGNVSIKEAHAAALGTPIPSKRRNSLHRSESPNSRFKFDPEVKEAVFSVRDISQENYNLICEFIRSTCPPPASPTTTTPDTE